MRQLLIITIILLYSCFALAKPVYQIDLIIFAQQSTAAQDPELSTDTPFLPVSANAIPLKVNSGKDARLYYLLPNSYSSLKNHYYLLTRKSSYPVLGHYSWRQPAKNQSKVALPLTEYRGWQIQGTFHVIQNAYYHFKADLQVSPPDNPHSSFTVSQKQRLKDNTVYYLDNERIGMVVKIHQIATPSS